MGRGGGGGATGAWHEEEDAGLKQSLHQKEAITAQMISIISTRLNSLQTVGKASPLAMEAAAPRHCTYKLKLVSSGWLTLLLPTYHHPLASKQSEVRSRVRPPSQLGLLLEDGAT